MAVFMPAFRPMRTQNPRKRRKFSIAELWVTKRTQNLLKRPSIRCKRIYDEKFSFAELSIHIFHTDQSSAQSSLRELSEHFGSEFKNQVIEQILETFGIERSLSEKGTPYDNAVAESMYNVIKTEFIFNREFADLAEFKLLWFDYVNWYNNIRIHGSLDYLTPSEWHHSADSYL